MEQDKQPSNPNLIEGQDAQQEAAYQKQNPGRAARIILAFIVAISVILAVVLVVMLLQFRNLRTSATNDAFMAAAEQTKNAVNSLNQTFEGAMALAGDFADGLSEGTLPYDNIEERLQQTLKDRPWIDGVTVAFEPYAYSPEQRLQTIYVYRDKEERIRSQVGEPDYDYTLPPSSDPDSAPTAWYWERVKEGASWSEPFFDEGTEKVLIQYGLPFYQTDSGSGDSIVAGVITMDTAITNMQSLVMDLDLGETGYGAVYSQEGTWLAYPISERVTTQSIYDSPRIQENPEVLTAAESAMMGEPAYVEGKNALSGKDVWDIFAPIESTGWTLLAELAQSEYLPDAHTTLQEVTRIILVAAALLFCILLLLFRVDHADPQRLWAASLSFTFITLFVIVILITLSLRTTSAPGIKIITQAGLHSYLENVEDDYTSRGVAPPVNIPSGILIQAARFPDNGSVVVNGYVWQRIPHLESEVIAPGFTLPQLIDEPIQTEEIYREERDDETLVVYTFIAALRQAFDPLEYPFDRHDIRIRLAPQEVKNNALLVPDLQSFEVTRQELFPGIDSGVRINNWRILSSYFGFVEQQYGTNMGIPGRPISDVPEMNFHINTQRRFLGPFIAFLLPALVAAAMIFAFLLYDAKPDEPEEIVTSLSYTAALFFVIAVMHTALRDDAAAIGLTYLEYFYLLLYVLVVLVAINTFLVVWRPQYAFVRYGNNLITKILFWPVVMGVMLVATLSIFVFG